MSGKTLWNRDYIWQVYELAKSGMIERNIAKTLGISLETFRRWEKKNPVIKNPSQLFGRGVKRGRNYRKKSNGSVFSLRDYVHGRLPKALKETWDKINRCDRVKNGVERIEAILSNGGRNVRQGLFFHSFMLGNFSLSAALRRVNISRGTLELWKKDPEFLQLFEECREIKGDFFEEHYITLIAGGCVPAIIHAQQTYNRDRGYGAEVKIKVSGEIQHNVVQFGELEKYLSLKTKKKILEAHRKFTLVNNKVDLPAVKQIESKVI